jgi:hypothetical protein
VLDLAQARLKTHVLVLKGLELLPDPVGLVPMRWIFEGHWQTPNRSSAFAHLL